jgi:serine/threonine protein kinase
VYSIDGRDQFYKIISALSSYDESQFDFVKNQTVLSYISQILSISEVREPYKQLKPEYEDLIKKVLLLNPYSRMTASQVIKHPVFNCLRIPALECQISNPISLEVDQMSINPSSGELDEYTHD